MDGVQPTATFSENTVVLSAGERATILAVTSSLPFFRIQDLDAKLVQKIAGLKGCLPNRLVARLNAFRDLAGQPAALLIRDLPVDDALPPTPQDGRPSPRKHSRLSEHSLLLVMSVIGPPVGYAEEKQGNLIHDVCPKPGDEQEQANTGSQYFDVHTENAFHPFRPDFVGLICLRPDHYRTAETLTASAGEVLPLLSAGEVGLLRQPLFQTQMPASFSAAPEVGAFSPAVAVLYGSTNDPCLRVDAFNTRGVTDEAQTALRALVAALQSKLTGWRLEPGDLMIVDNRRAIHARSAFRPQYDGHDRWLQRLYTVTDLASSSAVRVAGSYVCGALAP